MQKYLSDKLKAISFTLMVMVVFIHSYNLKVKFNSETEIIKSGYSSLFQDFISQGVTRIAVPLFFTISGYLFFLSIKKGSANEFFSKYKKRSKSLVLPYLLWSLYGVLFFLILQSIPFSKNFFTNELIVEYSISHLLSTIFINPIPYQLWFIRDLIILIVLSPILYGIIKYFKYYSILFFLITWIFDVSYLIFSNESLLFFAIGALFSINKINLQNIKIRNQYIIIITLVWFMLITYKTSLVYLNSENESLIIFLSKSSILIGVISIWFLYDYLFLTKDISKTKFYNLFQYTFFLYAFHEPILIIFKKAFYFILGNSELNSLLIYILAPTITIVISILTGFYLKKNVPKFYYLLTGGR